MTTQPMERSSGIPGLMMPPGPGGNSLLENLAVQFANPMAIRGPKPGDELMGTPSHPVVNITPYSKTQNFNDYAQQTAGRFLQNQMFRKRNDFMQNVHKVMSSSASPKDKITNLIALKTQYGTDFGLGVDDIVKQFKDVNKLEKWEPTTRQEALDFEREKNSMKPRSMASLENAKNKRVEELIDTAVTNSMLRDNVMSASQAAENIMGGIRGKVTRDYLKNLAPNDPILGEWQKIKSVLTNAQLLYTAKTKGAISDREMELFSQAAANDDMASLPQIRVSLDNMFRKLNAEEDAAVSSYQKIYGEDPQTWPEFQSNRKKYKSTFDTTATVDGKPSKGGGGLPAIKRDFETAPSGQKDYSTLWSN